MISKYIFLLVMLLLLSGCGTQYVIEVPTKNGIYKANIYTAQTSDAINVDFEIDPITEKITKIHFSKTGTTNNNPLMEKIAEAVVNKALNAH